MGLLDRIGKAFSGSSNQGTRREKRLLDPTKPANITYDDPALYSATFNSLPRHRIFEILDECGIEYEDDKKDPHSQMRLSHMAYGTIPFVKRVIEDMAAMVGNVEVDPESVGEERAEELNTMLREIPIVTERDWENAQQKGIDNLAFRMARGILKNGMYYGQDRMRAREGAKFQGHLIFDPRHFWFVREDKEKPMRLRYAADQYVKYDQFFHMVGYDYEEETPYAKPLISGGGFFLEILLSILVGIKNVNTRKGAPLNLTMVSLKSDDVLRDEKGKEAYINGMNALQNKLQAAIQMQAKGRPAAMIGKSPAAVDIVNQAFGAEGLDDVDPNILSMIMVGFANLLKVPPELMGIVFGGSGFSDARFETLSEIWFHHIDNLRETIRPSLRGICRNYLLSQEGVPAEVAAGVKIIFKSAELTNDTKKAETEKIKAETNKTHTEVAQALNEVDTTLARRYIEQNINIEE